MSSSIYLNLRTVLNHELFITWHFRSEFFLIHNKAEEKQEVMKNKVAKKSCSSETVLKVLGYELCGAVSFINATGDDSAPYFPLTGPVSISSTIHKKDAPKGFRFLGKLIHVSELGLLLFLYSSI